VTKALPAADGRPARVYVDLPGVVLAPTLEREAAGRGVVRVVRVGQFDPSTARVVVDLAGPHTVAVEGRGTDLTLRLRPGAADAPTPATPSASGVRADRSPTAVPHVSAPRGVDDATVQLRREVAERRVAGDRPGVVASYATWGAAAASRLDATTQAGVADALREIGLVEEAGRVLGDEHEGEAAVLRIARAELALASGDPAAARRVLEALETTPPSGMIAEPLARLRAHVALADGDLGTATAVAKKWPDPRLVTDVATAALAAGRAAAAARSWDRARDAYDIVLAADVDGALRNAAAAGQAQVAFAIGDREAATHALGVLETAGDPTLRRVAFALGSDLEEEGR